PPISWRTLGRLLLSRVPLPAAMMAMAKSGVVIDLYGLMFGFVLSYRLKGWWRIIVDTRSCYGYEHAGSSKRISCDCLSPGLRLRGWAGTGEKFGGTGSRQRSVGHCSVAE